METYNPAQYWEQRLAKNYDFAGVGFHSVGLPYNRWLYKIRRRVFNNILGKIDCDLSTAAVLDIGSGTGFYIDLFKQKCTSNLTGIDITDIAVKQLSLNYPGTVFLKEDISNSEINLPTRQFQLVTMMDVLFHITEDVKYTQAIQNAARIIQSGGYLIFSENFGSKDQNRGHIRDRKSEDIIAKLISGGFEIVQRVPMFILMNPPSSSDIAILRYFSNARVKLLRWSTRRELPLIGHYIGLFLFPIEILLHWVWPKNKGGPCTDYLICRRKQD